MTTVSLDNKKQVVDSQLLYVHMWEQQTTAYLQNLLFIHNTFIILMHNFNFSILYYTSFNYSGTCTILIQTRDPTVFKR